MKHRLTLLTVCLTVAALAAEFEPRGFSVEISRVPVVSKDSTDPPVPCRRQLAQSASPRHRLYDPRTV